METQRESHAKSPKTIAAQQVSARGNMMLMLPDGIYDVFVVWAETVGEDAISIELTVIAGAHKGEVVSVRMRHPRRVAHDPFDLVGLPCRLSVRDGEPRVEFDA